MKLVLLFIVCIYIKCTCIKVKFLGCEGKGFHCEESITFPGKQDISYQCPSDDLKDITIDFWIWSLPQNASKITICNCHTLRLSFLCAERYQNIDILHVHHVVDLRISQDDTICNPFAIVFEEIDFLRSVPKYSFSQTRSVCKDDYCGLHQLVFENVKIGTIETNGIELTNNIGLFRITNAVIDSIEVSGISIWTQKDASVYIMNSSIGNLEPLAVQVFSRKLTIIETDIGRLSFGGISATLNTFEFNSNTIAATLSGALVISAEMVNIFRNKFYTVSTGAFSKVGPYQGTFKYNFLNNYIHYVDAGGLHPQAESLSRFRSEIAYANNSFYCTCKGLAWLGSEINFGVGYDLVKDFYKSILNSTNNNTCTFDLDCILPLRAVMTITHDGICQTTTMYDQQRFCENYKDGSSTQFLGSHCIIIASFLLTLLYLL